MSEVAIIATGVANIASVIAGINKAGAKAVVTSDPTVIQHASHVLLPGVGAFAAGMGYLEQQRLNDVLIERIERGDKTMAICLGLQLLFERSDESPGVSGLGIFAGHIQRFNAELRCPQLGWNEVRVNKTKWLQDGHAYFANSYRLTTPPNHANIATSDYGGEFISAFEYKSLLACQFHPELSGEWGISLLRRWLTID